MVWGLGSGVCGLGSRGLGLNNSLLFTTVYGLGLGSTGLGV